MNKKFIRIGCVRRLHNHCMTERVRRSLFVVRKWLIASLWMQRIPCLYDASSGIDWHSPMPTESTTKSMLFCIRFSFALSSVRLQVHCCGDSLNGQMKHVPVNCKYARVSCAIFSSFEIHLTEQCVVEWCSIVSMSCVSITSQSHIPFSVVENAFALTVDQRVVQSSYRMSAEHFHWRNVSPFHWNLNAIKGMAPHIDRISCVHNNINRLTLAHTLTPIWRKISLFLCVSNGRIGVRAMPSKCNANWRTRTFPIEQNLRAVNSSMRISVWLEYIYRYELHMPIGFGMRAAYFIGVLGKMWVRDGRTFCKKPK